MRFVMRFRRFSSVFEGSRRFSKVFEGSHRVPIGRCPSGGVRPEVFVGDIYINRKCNGTTWKNRGKIQFATPVLGGCFMIRMVRMLYGSYASYASYGLFEKA